MTVISDKTENSIGKLIIYSGPSGVGKDTVRKLLDEKRLNLAYSISMTTREPRPGEVDGVDYLFVSREEFEKAIENGQLLEYTQYVNNYYGTPLFAVEKLISQGKNVLLEIEVDGARQVLEKNPQALSIFLLPPSVEELENRIKNRQTEKEEVIKSRLAQAIEELKQQDLYRYKVVNDTPQNAALQITRLIEQDGQEI